MKKKIAAALALACAVFSMSGCSKGGADAPIDLSAAVQSVDEAAGFTEELVQLDDATLPKSYTLLDLSEVEEYAVYVSGSLGTPEELALIKCKSSDDVAHVRDAVNRRVEDLTLSFQDYRPEQMPKIQNAVILEKGPYVMLAIAPESEAVRGVLEKL